jgi:hypothetical protein
MLFGGFFYSPSLEYSLRFRRTAGMNGLRFRLSPGGEGKANLFLNRPKFFKPSKEKRPNGSIS